MTSCKKCGSNNTIKSGVVGGRQRFRCKKCNYNFRIGDKRTDKKTIAKKLLCILIYFTTKNSFRTVGKLVQTDPRLVHRWVQKFNRNLPTPQLFNRNREPIDFDEIWRFIGLKKEIVKPLKQLVITRKKLLPNYLVTIILQHLDDYSTQ